MCWISVCLPRAMVLAAATLEAQDGQLVSSVNLLDLTRKQETRRLDFTGEIIVDMAVLGGDQNLYVLTDKKFYEISLSAATVLNTYDFSAQGLWYYHFDEGIFTLVTGNYVEERSLNVVRLTPALPNRGTQPVPIISSMCVPIRDTPMSSPTMNCMSMTRRCSRRQCTIRRTPVRWNSSAMMYTISPAAVWKNSVTSSKKRRNNQLLFRCKLY